MLYPLSYEGLRGISYLPADSPGCPVVPTVTNWCPPVQWERFHFWWRGAPSIFRLFATPCAGRYRTGPVAATACPRLTEHPPAVCDLLTT